MTDTTSKPASSTLTLIAELLGGIGEAAANPAFGTAGAIGAIASLAGKLISLGSEGSDHLVDLNDQVKQMVAQARNPTADEWNTLRARSDAAHRLLQDLDDGDQQAGADAPNPVGGQSGAAAPPKPAATNKTAEARKGAESKGSAEAPKPAQPAQQSAQRAASSIPPKSGVTSHDAMTGKQMAQQDTAHVVTAQTIANPEGGKMTDHEVQKGSSSPQNAGASNK